MIRISLENVDLNTVDVRDDTKDHNFDFMQVLQAQRLRPSRANVSGAYSMCALLQWCCRYTRHGDEA